MVAERGTELAAPGVAGRDDRTIRDFGDQWHYHGENDAFYGSLELMQDMLGPLLEVGDFRGCRVADVGSGAGRIVRMLLSAGAVHVTALEPSRGVEVLRRNTQEFGDRVRVLHATGDALPADLNVDYVTAIGVLQFIPDPDPTLRAMRAALRPGGHAIVWVYAREGTRLYRLVLGALRSVTTRLPHALLEGLCTLLDWALRGYIAACRWLPLPLRAYARDVLAKLTPAKRRLTIYDQLNPTYVRYYSADELRDLLTRNGFHDVQLHDRHGYSWTAIGTRSPDAA
jgi:SAM-dependent methyltransferase